MGMHINEYVKFKKEKLYERFNELIGYNFNNATKKI